MNLMDWLGQHPEFSQRFDQFMANHPNFNPQPRMQFRGMTGGNTPAMQMPQVGTGGAGQRMPAFSPQMGGNGQAMPMHPFAGTGGPMQPQPTNGGYDGSGINPNGMYTGGNQRPQLNRMGHNFQPMGGGLAGYFQRFA